MNQKQDNSFLAESIQNIKTALDSKNLTIFAGSSVSADSVPIVKPNFGKLK